MLNLEQTLEQIDDLSKRVDKLGYPDPPRTNNIPRQQWPTSSEMTDDHLRRTLQKMQAMDMSQRRNPEKFSEENRRNLNQALVDLIQEADKRGLDRGKL